MRLGGNEEIGESLYKRERSAKQQQQTPGREQKIIKPFDSESTICPVVQRNDLKEKVGGVTQRKQMLLCAVGIQVRFY